MNDRDRRITELDGIRGIAALSVVVYHYHHHFRAQPWSEVLFPIYRGGHFNVDLFFVLSGFILSQVYVYDGRYSGVAGALVSRIARLYPLHLLTLLAVAVLQKFYVLRNGHCFIYSYNDAYHFVLNLLLLNQSGLQSGASFNGPSWSISTEFIVNVLFIAVALRSPGRALGLGVAFAAVVLAIQSRMGWTEVPTYLRQFYDLFRSILGFGVGLLLHAVYTRTRHRAMPRGVAGALLVPALALAFFAMSRPATHWSMHLLTLVCFPLIIVLSLRSSVAGRLLRARPVVHLGHISYSVYLLHYPLELFVKDVESVVGRPFPVASPVFLLAQVGICVLFSHFTWKWFEVPSRRWINAKLGVRAFGVTQAPSQPV